MTSTERSRRKYDQLADNYEELFFYVADMGRRLVELADPAPGTRVLDVGAGRGAVARAALARGCAVTAVDASPGMVARLTADYPELTVRQQDAGALDFPDGSFDLVTAGFVVQVLDDPAAALAEFRRVLAPGGTLALSLERQTVGRLGWLHDLYKRYFGGGSGSAMAAADLDALLDEAGFAVRPPVEVDAPKALDDAADMWWWMEAQGLPQALAALPAGRAEEFRVEFFAGAERMREEGGLVLEFGATLHLSTRP
ncbi:class I SAM-dependent methyltransferase [Actinophytocola xanthii]|uniref:SAM-dependent methyltransferase n=1 Tax=Actinophytocola xanthii TaxID=1912961 RepID=A0A1Q8C4G1_9PSEU|nr:class I SAM-dependent methyltransferase [Actinophytocola xanthii]OLF09254.1 SAM-dependent methyltransferase [Actinophytocola xanthii]